MISFFISLLILIFGYVFYSKIVENIFGPDDRVTPAVGRNDGVDYVVMPKWKIFLIQLLNIAGLGPIFGALQGALFGPIVFIWIAFGTVLAGGVHDYTCGMLSERYAGSTIAEVVGLYMGNKTKNVMRAFTVILLLMVGVVFAVGPAGLLVKLLLDVGVKGIFVNYEVILMLVFLYYFISTFVSIDKVIGRIYPVFGVCLIVMAVGVAFGMFVNKEYVIPEVWDHFYNMHPDKLPVWSYMFITVACGAISGFHSTQSPIMARCIKSEKDGRQIFYGAMVLEGVIALIWAAAGCAIYQKTGGLMTGLNEALSKGQSFAIYDVCLKTMGNGGLFLAVLGVIVCPITSGDTAFRSARLAIADWFRMDQIKVFDRLIIVIPLFVVGILIGHLDYSVIWRYFSWANQTLAMIVLWTISVYLVRKKKNYIITLIPAIFMSAVTMTYFIISKECLGILKIPYTIAVLVGVLFALLLYVLFNIYIKKHEWADDSMIL